MKPGFRACGHFHGKEYLGEMDLKSKERERAWLTGSGKMKEKAGDNYVKAGLRDYFLCTEGGPET